MPTKINILSQVKGMSNKTPCVVATTGNTSFSAISIIDGITLSNNDRVLVWKQSNATQNGIYIFSGGILTRALDSNAPDDFIQGMQILVISGNTYGETLFYQTSVVSTIGSSNINFGIFGGLNGTSGTTGTTGSSGESGTNGTSGTSGTSGSSGTSGTRGTSGTSGSSGTSGTSGTSPASQISGSGTVNYIPKFTGTTNLGNSIIYDDGTNVGIGNTATGGFKLDVSGTGRFTGGLTGTSAILDVVGANTTDKLTLSTYTTGVTGSNVRLRHARGTVASPTTIINADDLGQFIFQGYDGTSFLNGAQIKSGVDAAVSTGVMPGFISFLTNQGNERMRIASNGNVGIGTINPISTFTINSDAAGGVGGIVTNNVYPMRLINSPTAGSGSYNVFDLRMARGGVSNRNPSFSFSTDNIDGDFYNICQIGSIADLASGNTIAGNLIFSTKPSGSNVTERMRITSNGNVGIGTTTPTEKLHVVGNGLFTGAATFSSSVTAAGFNSYTGTVYAANVTWVTIYTIPSTQTAEGVYYAYGHYNDDSGGMAFTQVLADRSSVRAINSSNGATVLIQLSVRNIQVQHSYGVPVDIQYSILWQKLR